MYYRIRDNTKRQLVHRSFWTLPNHGLLPEKKWDRGNGHSENSFWIEATLCQNEDVGISVEATVG
jgi:hypothetical protein